MKKNDLITIAITCYNAQDTITKAIKSAIEQTWSNKEILIVDDASTDESVAVIKSFIKDYTCAKLIIHKNNLGPGAARQTLLQNANGIFLAFFDDDDVSLPSRVETQYRVISNYEQRTGIQLIACYASGRRIYPNDYSLNIDSIGSRPEIPYGSDVADRLLFFGGNPNFFYGGGTPTCSLMARTSTFRCVGGFDSKLRRMEDVDFAIRLSLKLGHFIGCNERLFIQFSTNAIDKSPEKNLEAELYLAEKHKEYLISKKKYTYSKKWPLLRYYHFKKKYPMMLYVLLGIFFKNPIKTLSHFGTTAPKRLLHEYKMRRSILK